MPDNLFTSLPQGSCCSSMLVITKFCKYCTLPWLIFISSTVFTLISHQILVIPAILWKPLLIYRKPSFQENLHLNHFFNKSLIHRYAIWANKQIGCYSHRVFYLLLPSASLMNSSHLLPCWNPVIFKTFWVLYIIANSTVANKFLHTAHKHLKKEKMLTFKIGFWIDCHFWKRTEEAGERNNWAVIFLVLSCRYNPEIDIDSFEWYRKKAVKIWRVWLKMGEQ